MSEIKARYLNPSLSLSASQSYFLQRTKVALRIAKIPLSPAFSVTLHGLIYRRGARPPSHKAAFLFWHLRLTLGTSWDIQNHELMTTQQPKKTSQGSVMFFQRLALSLRASPRLLSGEAGQGMP